MVTDETLDRLYAEMVDHWAPLGDQVAFRVERGGLGIGLHDGARLEVGSCFKAFVAAACCRDVGAGTLDWDHYLTITASDRVPSSSLLERFPDGHTLSLREAVDAMLAVSDNTATDLVLNVVGVERVRALLRELGLGETTIPASVASVYREASDTHAEACVTTMRDLTSFYRQMYEGSTSFSPAARAQFLECLAAEDRDQGTPWPAGVTCLRKSGSLEPPPVFAQAIAGILLQEGVPTLFAAAVNIPVADEAIPEESIAVFGSGLSHLLRTLSEPLAHT